MIYGRSFVTAVHHTVGALRIAGLGAVVFPFCRVHEFLECICVPVLQQIAGFLPAKDVVRGHAPGRARIIALAHQEFEEKRRLVEFPAFLAVCQDCAEQAPSSRAAEEMLLVRGFVVGIAGGKHHALDANLHHFVEEGAHALGIGAVKKRGVGGYAEATLQRFFDSVERQIITAFAAHGKVVMLFLPIHVNGKRQVLARLEKMEFFLEQEGIGAEIDVLLARDEAFHNLVNFGVHQRLAAGDGYHWRAALFHGFEAFFGRQFLLQDVSRILNLSTARASEIAPEQRLEHEHERVALTSLQLLLHDVRRDGPHL